MTEEQPFRVVIVDDEPLARAVVREFAGQHAGVEVVAECANGFEAVKAVSELSPDLIFLDVQMPKLNGFEVLELLGRAVPVVFTTDYDQYALRYGVPWAVRAGWHYLRWFYGQAHRVLCPSRIYEEHLHSRGVLHTGLWSRGVDPESFHPRFRSEVYRRRFGVERGDLLVTYIGRLAREKNLALLLEAWDRLAPTRGPAQLVLVGSGPLEEEIRRREIPGVHVPGLMHGRELSAAYASADVFTFPSTTETFGNSLLEAMGAGLPSLVAAAGGVLEFAEHGENAWLVAPNNASAIAEGLSRLLADAALRRRLAEGALRTAQARDWDEVYERLIQDYADAARAKAKGLIRAA